MSADLVAHIASFSLALREHGVRVALSDEVDGAVALALVDLLDREEVRTALRIAMKIGRDDRARFDELFDRFWTKSLGEPTPSRAPRPQRMPAIPRGESVPLAAPGETASMGDGGVGDRPGYSAEALLRKKPFDQCTPADLVAMERLLARLSLKLATLPSRRLVPTRGRGQVDLRRSFRRAIGTRGELLSLARRARAVEEPRLVLLCDTSGSMDLHSRFLLTFVITLKRVARRTEAFAFNTALTRLTPWLAPGKIGLTLDRLAAGVPDWSGGTRIGESLAEFVARYGDRMVDRSTVVVILSDGLDRGEPEVLVRALRDLRARARQLIWLNPLLGDARYEPTARGMQAALPYVDQLAPAHDLASLERFLANLAA